MIGTTGIGNSHQDLGHVTRRVLKMTSNPVAIFKYVILRNSPLFRNISMLQGSNFSKPEPIGLSFDQNDFITAAQLR
jgi:hypothetical protein